MGLAILSNKASADEKHIFTVCLSGAAHKFLKTILASGEHDDELTEHLQQRLLIYKQTALVALDRIPLTTTPSLALLQALLCGVSYPYLALHLLLLVQLDSSLTWR